MTVRIQALTAEHVRSFISWEYTEPYAVYNMSYEDPQEAAAFFRDPANGYFAIVDETDELLGFCNYGADARVPGGRYGEEALDIGMGMRPDLTGRGLGSVYAAEVFDFASRRYPNCPQRVTIAAFNQRAQRLCAHFGFQINDHFERAGDGESFVIMRRAINK